MDYYEIKKLKLENNLHSIFESVGFLDNLFARSTYISNKLQDLCEKRDLYSFKVDYTQQNYIIVYYQIFKASEIFSVVDKISQRKSKLERICK